ncbi:MAG: hypothetical protein WAK14_08945 [Methanobacterium sp.]
MPVLPFISDTEEEIESMVKTAKNYGANYILSAGLTLYGYDHGDCKILYFKFLEENYPDLLLSYRKLFRGSFAPSKEYQDDLVNKFDKVTRKYGIKNSLI